MTGWPSARRRTAGAVLGVALAAAGRPAAAQGAATSGAAASCAPTAIAASRFDSVRVVVAVAPFDSTYVYAWSAPDGAVHGTGPVVTWSLAGAAVGPDSITARVTRGGVPVATCIARLAVVSPIAGDSARGEHDLAARALLLRGKDVAPGYARYSYVLFSAKPTAQTRAVYRTMLREYVRHFQPAASYAGAHGSDSAAVRLFHGVYVPVTADVPDTLQDDSLVVERILRQYDYARANTLLGLLPGQHFIGGPYLVTVRAPLMRPVATGGYLLQNYAGKPEQVVADCVTLFLNDAVQDRARGAWDPQSLGVRLESMFALTAQAVKPVAGGIKYWQDFFKGVAAAR